MFFNALKNYQTDNEAGEHYLLWGGGTIKTNPELSLALESAKRTLKPFL